MTWAIRASFDHTLLQGDVFDPGPPGQPPVRITQSTLASWVRENIPLVEFLHAGDSGFFTMTMHEFLALPATLMDAWRIFRVEKQRHDATKGEGQPP